MEKQQMFQTTNQYLYIYIHMCHGQKLGKRPMEIVITPFHRYGYGSKPW